jgi:hypothetical protein
MSDIQTSTNCPALVNMTCITYTDWSPSFLHITLLTCTLLVRSDERTRDDQANTLVIISALVSFVFLVKDAGVLCFSKVLSEERDRGSLRGGLPHTTVNLIELIVVLEFMFICKSDLRRIEYADVNTEAGCAGDKWAYYTVRTRIQSSNIVVHCSC